MALTANELKMYSSLKTKKFRIESGLFVVEGEKMVSEALTSGFESVAVLDVKDCGQKTIDKISTLSTPPSILAVLRQKQWSFSIEKGKTYLALDSVRDPGNMGTIIRIADWFGIDGILASPDSVEIYNPKVVQATMGAIFRVPFVYKDLPATLEDDKVVSYGTFLDRGACSLYEISAPAKDKAAVIVVGNESNGISEAVGSKVTHRVFIPPYPKDSHRSESLNVAVATAICVSNIRSKQTTL